MPYIFGAVRGVNDAFPPQVNGLSKYCTAVHVETKIYKFPCQSNLIEKLLSSANASAAGGLSTGVTGWNPFFRPWLPVVIVLKMEVFRSEPHTD